MGAAWMSVLLSILIVYVAVCWLWGMYMAVRLYSGRRLSRLLRGSGVRTRITRNTMQDTTTRTKRTPGTPGVPAIAEETLAKAEAAAAKSRAA